MSTRTVKTNITLAYADASTRTVSFDNIAPTRTITQIADAIDSINNNMSDAFKQTFLSKDGAPCTSIGKAQYIETEEEMIYSAS